MSLTNMNGYCSKSNQKVLLSVFYTEVQDKNIATISLFCGFNREFSRSSLPSHENI